MPLWLYKAVKLRRAKNQILSALADARDLVFVRSHGNIGDQLIELGIRTILQGWRYQEVQGADLGEARGHSAVIAGGGAWCAPYHEFMPELLPQVELRFERVVVLPSSFDVQTVEVRNALERTRAVVFAREPESYRQIRSLCDARLAHDCALFADLRRWRRPGSGVLNAFRIDRESQLLSLGVKLPKDNVDISATAGSLDEWLRTLAGAARIRTDRAHVMIAGAMLGKTVEFVASSYHKVPAIAAHSLCPYRVRPLSFAEISHSKG
ncbi:MAG: polysaccharide pyruvyl transferase family protein [Terrimicrobiaceae bacterium]